MEKGKHKGFPWRDWSSDFSHVARVGKASSISPWFRRELSAGKSLPASWGLAVESEVNSRAWTERSQ